MNSIFNYSKFLKKSQEEGSNESILQMANKIVEEVNRKYIGTLSTLAKTKLLQYREDINKDHIYQSILESNYIFKDKLLNYDDNTLRLAYNGLINEDEKIVDALFEEWQSSLSDVPINKIFTEESLERGQDFSQMSDIYLAKEVTLNLLSRYNDFILQAIEKKFKENQLEPTQGQIDEIAEKSRRELQENLVNNENKKTLEIWAENLIQQEEGAGSLAKNTILILLKKWKDVIDQISLESVYTDDQEGTNVEQKIGEVLELFLQQNYEELQRRVDIKYEGRYGEEDIRKLLSESYFKVLTKIEKTFEKKPQETDEFLMAINKGQEEAVEKLFEIWVNNARSFSSMEYGISTEDYAADEEGRMGGGLEAGEDVSEQARGIEQQEQQKQEKQLKENITLRTWLNEMALQKPKILSDVDRLIRRIAAEEVKTEEGQDVTLKLDSEIYINLYVRYYFQTIDWVLSQLIKNIQDQTEIVSPSGIRGLSYSVSLDPSILGEDVEEIEGEKELLIPLSGIDFLISIVDRAFEETKNQRIRESENNFISIEEMGSMDFVTDVIALAQREISSQFSKQVSNDLLQNIVPKLKHRTDIISTSEYINKMFEYNKLLEVFQGNEMEELADKIHAVQESRTKSEARSSIRTIINHLPETLLKQIDELSGADKDETYKKALRENFVFRLLRHYSVAEESLNQVDEFNALEQRKFQLQFQLRLEGEQLSEEEQKQLREDIEAIQEEEKKIIKHFSNRKDESRQALVSLGERMGFFSSVRIKNVGKLIRSDENYREFFKRMLIGMKEAIDDKIKTQESIQEKVDNLSQLGDQQKEEIVKNINDVMATKLLNLFRIKDAAGTSAVYQKVLTPFVKMMQPIREAYSEYNKKQEFSVPFYQFIGDKDIADAYEYAAGIMNIDKETGTVSRGAFANVQNLLQNNYLSLYHKYLEITQNYIYKIVGDDNLPSSEKDLDKTAVFEELAYKLLNTIPEQVSEKTGIPETDIQGEILAGVGRSPSFKMDENTGKRYLEDAGKSGLFHYLYRCIQNTTGAGKTVGINQIMKTVFTTLIESGYSEEDSKAILKDILSMPLREEGKQNKKKKSQNITKTLRVTANRIKAANKFSKISARLLAGKLYKQLARLKNA